MSNSLHARCIRRWKQRFKPVCDSKFSPYWRKYHLRGFIRETAIITADCMVERMAEDNAKFDYDGTTIGWSPEFAAWYDERREQYRREALVFLNEEATNGEVDEEIDNELEAWND